MIPRSEVQEVERPGWILLFGRRKTGKTFMLKHMIKHDNYFFVTRGGLILELDEQIPYPVFEERIKNLLLRDVTIVIDEFQRLPERFLDLLHYHSPESRAKLILVGSSFSVARRLMERRSPLLGIVRPVRIGLIRPADVVKGLSKLDIPAELILRIAPYISDPWIMRFVDPRSFSRSEVIDAIRFNVPALIGEVFSEEERTLTDRYELVIRALSLGNSSPGEIASYISGFFEKELRSQDVKSYLANLLRMGIASRIQLMGRKRYLYSIESPLIDLFYYLDTKLGYYEVDVPMEELENLASVREGTYFERFVVELIASLYRARVQRSLEPEIDGILVKKGRIVASVEVKMGQISREEISSFVEKGPKEGERIVVAREGPAVEGVTLLTPPDILSILKESSK
ncbi:MAG: AAA family ATPase [Candidatus Methanodesulfokora sp.]